MRAGIRMDQVPTSDFEHVLQVNLVGTYRVSQQAIPYLEKSPGGGVIINLSSCRAVQQGKHGEAYTASKAGIEGLTMAMSVSLGPAIRVHAISPGMVDVRSERDESALPDVNTIREDLNRDFQSEYAPQWGAGKSQALHDAHPVGRIGKGDDIARYAFHCFNSWKLECCFLTTDAQMDRILVCQRGWFHYWRGLYPICPSTHTKD